MKTPLIPYEQYEEFGKLDQLSEEELYCRIKALVNQLPPLNRNTLKFCIKFFKEVVENENTNRMSSYNIAVTVGPNIFRPRSVKNTDIMSVGIYYSCMIKMIETYDTMFDGKEVTESDLVIAADGLRHGAVGSVGGENIASILGTIDQKDKDLNREESKDDSDESGEDFLEQMRRADEEEKGKDEQV